MNKKKQKAKNKLIKQWEERIKHLEEGTYKKLNMNPVFNGFTTEEAVKYCKDMIERIGGKDEK